MERNATNRHHAALSNQAYGSLDNTLEVEKLNVLLRQPLSPSKQVQTILDFLALTQRPINSTDLSFLQDLYCSSRDHEVTQSGIPEPMLRQFLLQQFSLQQKHYHNAYKTTGFKVIEYKGRAIGRLYIEVTNDGIHLLDITLLREYRKQGVGCFLISQLIRQADKQQCRISLYVQSQNPALKFYQRLGFNIVGSKQDYFSMEYRFEQAAEY